MSFDKVGYDNNYLKENYDRFNIIMPKGAKVVLKDLSEREHKSIAQLIIHALEIVYHIELK